MIPGRPESGCGRLRFIVVKSLAGLLIIILMLHLQCGGSCLLESFGAKANVASPSSEPPCHQHSETPPKDKIPAHDGNSPCNQGPVTESKWSTGASLMVHTSAVVPGVIENPTFESVDMTGFVPEQPPHLLFPLHRLSVLRI